MALKSMKLSPKESKAEAATMEYKAPDYPYGLCLDLDKEALDKLAVDGLPDVGQVVTGTFKATVRSVSAYKSDNNDNQSCSLQITDLDVDFGSDKNADAAQALYGKNDA